MILSFREIRSRVGDEERVLTALRQCAAGLVRDRQADAVLVCERADIPQDLLWIQHSGGLPGPGSYGEYASRSLEPGLVVWQGEPVRVQFIDGIYRFPLPPCRLWRVETRKEAVGRALLNACRLAASDGRIGGVSIYRPVEDSSRMIGFVALAADIALAEFLVSLGADDNAESACHPLRVSWSVGRLSPGASPVSSLVRYPGAAFWTRLGRVSLPEVATVVGR